MSSGSGVDMCVLVGYVQLRDAVSTLKTATTAVERFRALFKWPLATANDSFDAARNVIAGSSRYSLTLTTYVQLLKGGSNITMFRRPCWPSSFSRAQYLR